MLLKKFILFSFLLFFFLILLGTIFFKAVFSMVIYGDRLVLINQNLLLLIIGFLTFALIFIIFWRITDSLKEKQLFKIALILLAINIMLQFLVIYFFRINLTADWEVVYGNAKEIINNNFSSLLPGGYIYMFPNNLGITTYFIISDLLFKNNINNVYILRIINVFYNILTTIIIYKIFCLLNQSNKHDSYKLLIIISLFLPSIFMSNQLYNEVLSTLLFLLGVYFSLIYIDKTKIKYLVLSVLFISLGNYIRSLGLLFAASLVLYLLINKTSYRNVVLFILLTIIGLIFPIQIINTVLINTKITHEPLGINNIPISKWLYMGSNPNSMGYWDQGVSDRLYRIDAQGNKQKANSIYWTSIRSNLNTFGVFGILEVYWKKSVWIWSEGTFQSVYLGMSQSAPGGYMKDTPVSQYFNQNLSKRNIFKDIMYYWNISSIIIIIFFYGLVVIKKKWKIIENKELILPIIILSFSCFYTLWEVKSRYLYPLFPYFLLLSVLSFIKLKSILSKNG